MTRTVFETLKEMGEIVFASLVPLSDAIFSFGKNNPHDYQAHFLKENKLLSKTNQGFVVTGKKQLSKQLSYRNMLVCGQSGSGKTSSVIIPSLLAMNTSLVVHDPSGELFHATSGRLQNEGYQVMVLNYGDPAASVGFNPLIRAHSPSDISKVISTLVRATLGDNAKDPFWSLQAISLISIPIAILVKQQREYLNLANVRRLVEVMAGDPKKMDKLVVGTGDMKILDSYKSFIAMSQNTFSSIAATALAALNLFQDEKLALITSADSIDFRQFRKKKTALFIQSPTIDMKYYASVTSILTSQLFGTVMNELPKKGEHDIFFLLDEASSLTIPNLPIVIANIRKYNCGIMLIVQDFAQLQRVYGKEDAESIRTNCYTKLYFSGQSLQTAQELEKILGKYTFVDEHNRKQSRPLMTADEIRSMDIEKSLIICGHNRPILARMTPFYKNRKFRNQVLLPPPKVVGDITQDEVAFLPLTK